MLLGCRVLFREENLASEGYFFWPSSCLRDWCLESRGCWFCALLLNWLKVEGTDETLLVWLVTV